MGNHRDIGGSYSNLRTTHFAEYSSTEEEWKHFLDLGILLEKACELVRRGNRHPKPSWEYSPESPSPQPYDVPYGTVLIPNPHSPRDAEGRRIKEMEQKTNRKENVQDHTTAEEKSTSDENDTAAVAKGDVKKKKGKDLFEEEKAKRKKVEKEVKVEEEEEKKDK